jgi:hypothetical protein
MAEFVRAQIFGTTFEITSRYGHPPPELCPQWNNIHRLDMLTSSLLAWAPLVWSGMDRYLFVRIQP